MYISPQVLEKHRLVPNHTKEKNKPKDTTKLKLNYKLNENIFSS